MGGAALILTDVEPAGLHREEGRLLTSPRLRPRFGLSPSDREFAPPDGFA